MSFSFRLRSHPDKLLRDHLKNVAKLSKDIVDTKVIGNKEIFSQIAYLVGSSHDFGKATTFFQEMLNNGEKTKYANHGFLSSLFGYYVIKDYLNKINKLDDFLYLPAVVWIVINKHHGDLRNIGEIDGEISKLDDEGNIRDCQKQVENIITNNLTEIDAIYTELIGELNLQRFIDIFANLNEIKKFVKGIRKDLFKPYL